MSALQFVHPSSVEEAIAWLAASPVPVSSLTQHRIRGEAHLRESFRSGRRRPAWVWGVVPAGDRVPLGVIAAFGTNAPDDRALVLDHFGLPDDPRVARALVARATAEAVAAGAEEADIFGPTDVSVDDPALARLVDPLREVGCRLLVERRHYEYQPPRGLGDGIPTELFLEQPTGADDPRLAACHREVMRGTLDPTTPS